MQRIFGPLSQPLKNVHSSTRTLSTIKLRPTSSSSSSSCINQHTVSCSHYSTEAERIPQSQQSSTSSPSANLSNRTNNNTSAPRRTTTRTKFSPYAERGHGNYLLSAYCTPNNFLCTLSRVEKKAENDRTPATRHKVYVTETSGTCGFRKGNRGTSEAATQVANRMLVHVNNAISGVKPTRLDKMARKSKVFTDVQVPPLETLQVRWKGTGLGRDALFKVLMSDDAKPIRNYIVNIGDRTPISIGGCRPRKPRKV